MLDFEDSNNKIKDNSKKAIDELKSSNVKIKKDVINIISAQNENTKIMLQDSSINFTKEIETLKSIVVATKHQSSLINNLIKNSTTQHTQIQNSIVSLPTLELLTPHFEKFTTMIPIQENINLSIISILNSLKTLPSSAKLVSHFKSIDLLSKSFSININSLKEKDDENRTRS
jgi:hypothetical protein